MSRKRSPGPRKTKLRYPGPESHEPTETTIETDSLMGRQSLPSSTPGAANQGFGAVFQGSLTAPHTFIPLWKAQGRSRSLPWWADAEADTKVQDRTRAGGRGQVVAWRT